MVVGGSLCVDGAHGVGAGNGVQGGHCYSLLNKECWTNAFFANAGLVALHTAGNQRDIPDRETTDWRAVCGKTARAVVCPVKAGMFSRGQSCRGRSQKPRSSDSGGDGNRTFEAYRQGLRQGDYESPGRINRERIVASKVRMPEGRARNRRVKAA